MVGLRRRFWPRCGCKIGVLGLAAWIATLSCKPPDPLQKLRHDAADPRTRAATLPQLAALRSPEATALVIKYLQEPGDWQPAAAAAAGQYELRDAVGPLIDVLVPVDKEATATALNIASIAALQKLGATEAADKLIRVVQNGTPPAKAAAIFAIGALKLGGAAPLLVQLCFDHSQLEVVHASLQALGALHSELGAAPLTQALFYDDLQQDAKASLIALGPAAVPALAQALSRKSSLVQNMRTSRGELLPAGAIEARVAPVLGAIASPLAVQTLVRAGQGLLATKPKSGASSDDVNAGLVQICRALRQANNQEARQILQTIEGRASRDPRFASIAQEAGLALAPPPYPTNAAPPPPT